MPPREILIEGFTAEQLLDLEDLEGLVATGTPLAFRVGSASILAEFAIDGQTLNVAVVEQGGEGVLPTLISVIERFAARRGLSAIEWWIYARNCASPNPKLERVLTRLGFEVRQTPAGSECYWLRNSTNASLRRSGSI